MIGRGFVLGGAIVLAAFQTASAASDPVAGRHIAERGTQNGAQPCSACHQADGRGNEALGAPRLAGQTEFYLAKQLRDYASGSRQNDIMTPIAKALNDQQRDDAAAYYAHLDAPYPPVKAADPQALAHGGALVAMGSQKLRVEGCVNCHGPQATGLAPSYPALAGQYASYLSAQYKAWRGGTRGNDPQGVMRMIFSRIDQKDADAIMQYLASLRPTSQPGAELSGTTAEKK